MWLIVYRHALTARVRTPSGAAPTSVSSCAINAHQSIAPWELTSRLSGKFFIHMVGDQFVLTVNWLFIDLWRWTDGSEQSSRRWSLEATRMRHCSTKRMECIKMENLIMKLQCILDKKWSWQPKQKLVLGKKCRSKVSTSINLVTYN